MVIKSGREPDPAKRIRLKQGNLIRQIRTMRGMSRQELADAIAEQGVTITVHSVSQWENAVASPRPVMTIAIAKALDVPWSTIFSLDGETL